MPTTPTSMTTPSSSTFKTNLSRRLDSQQVDRITRMPGSTILFASFDPGTASGDRLHAFRKLSLNEELCRPKRIVVEVSPDGKSSWRFVPKARYEEGVDSEGSWPRTVDLSGQLTQLTQDQWDTYKLDPDYECIVRLAPHPTSITKSTIKKAPNGSFADTLLRLKATPLERKPINFKRHLFGMKRTTISARRPFNNGLETDAKDTSDSELSDVDSALDIDGEDAEEDEVKLMVGEDKTNIKRKREAQARIQKVRANIEEAKALRKAWNDRIKDKNLGRGLSPETQFDNDVTYEENDEDEAMMGLSDLPSSPLQSSKRAGTSSNRSQTVDPSMGKRKVRVRDELSEDDREVGNEGSTKKFKPYEYNGEAKRVRTVSPSQINKTVQQKRHARGQKRLEEQRRRSLNRAQARDEALLSEIFAQAADSSYRMEDDPRMSEKPQVPETDFEIDDEAQHQAKIEESRRKMAELFADSNSTTTHAHQHSAQDSEEKSKTNADRQKAAEAEALRATAEREKQRKKLQEEERRMAAEAAFEARSKYERAKRQAQKEVDTWRRVPWSAARAYQRYNNLSEAFDKANFHRGEAVVVFESIPWPMLARPGTYGVEDVDWTSVESFFKHVKTLISHADYVKLLDKSHKRFHPDRWRSRRVLANVIDDDERECLLAAATTVEQALTPIWHEETGR